MEDSIFARIIKGDIPCHKVYEDDKVIAFLDIHPIQPGQVLVVPKVEVDHFWDLSEGDYIAVAAVCKRVAQRLREVFPDKLRVASMVEGLDVPHAHVKLFPFTTHEEFQHQPDMSVEPDHAALAELAQKLAF